MAKALEAEIKGESELRDAVFSAGTVRTPNPCLAFCSRGEFAPLSAVLGGVQMMALRMEHAPVATKEDGDEEGRLCALCKQNCYFSFVAWCVARRGSTVLSF